MNERTADLFAQALDEAVPETWTTLNPVQLMRLRDKFAELIVRECAKAFEAEVDTWKEMDPYQGSIKRQGAKAIKQHFGIEE